MSVGRTCAAVKTAAVKMAAGGIGCLIAVLLIDPAQAASVADKVSPLANIRAGKLHLTPHRAVYDLTLAQAESSSGISDMNGKLVFEFSGSTCAGFTMNMRFVSQIADSDGAAALTDMRSSTWESADGETFRFNSTQYVDSALKEATTGNARRARGKTIAIDLAAPVQRAFSIDPDVAFPTEHLVDVILAAQDGRHIFQRRVYDGSETGDKVFDTMAVIGPSRAGNNAALPQNAAGMRGAKAWPVSIAYFHDGADGGEQVPTYQLSYLLYSNGVSDELLLDYGDFTLKGRLASIEFLNVAECN